MRNVAVGSDDHYPVVDFIVEELKRRGFDLIKVGFLREGKPYPWQKVGFEVGELVAKGEALFGVVICYTGTGVCIAANKVKGIRAALCFDSQTARGARMWNDANVLAISGRFTSNEVAREIIDAWLSVEKPDPSEIENIEELKRMERYS
jgi:ribose 5-phosphate isomerase B